MKSVEPIIKREVGRQTVEVGGKMKVVDEIIRMDYGKQGTTVMYMIYLDEPIDIAAINSVAAKRGLRLAIPEGVEIR